MRKPLFEIMEELKKARGAKKIELLQYYGGDLLFREFIAYMVNPNIKWLLPEGDPPYTPASTIDSEEGIYANVKKLYLYVKGGNPNLKEKRREQLFVELLETIHPEDAKMILLLKDGKLKGVTEKNVRDAWPGFLTYKEKT